MSEQRLRTIYLQSYLSINGRNSLRGRVLYDRFSELSEETVLGHIVRSDEYAAGVDPAVRSDIVSLSLLRELQANVLFIEGGLFADRDAGTWKVPEEIAREVCQSGGVVIVADDPDVYRHKMHYLAAETFFKASISYGDNGRGLPIYGEDTRHFYQSYRAILCDPKKMVLSDWIRPIYKDVPEVLVVGPLLLRSWESIVASCNSDSTSTLHSDLIVDPQNACPFASVARIGSGFAVFIAGQVSDDRCLQGCTHNSRWLTNLATFLVDEAS